MVHNLKMTLKRRRPLMLPPSAVATEKDNSCSSLVHLDDVHKVLREAHDSHGLSSSKLETTSLRRSIQTMRDDLTSALTSVVTSDDDESRASSNLGAADLVPGAVLQRWVPPPPVGGGCVLDDVPPYTTTGYSARAPMRPRTVVDVTLRVTLTSNEPHDEGGSGCAFCASLAKLLGALFQERKHGAVIQIGVETPGWSGTDVDVAVDARVAHNVSHIPPHHEGYPYGYEGFDDYGCATALRGGYRQGGYQSIRERLALPPLVQAHHRGSRTLANSTEPLQDLMNANGRVNRRELANSGVPRRHSSSSNEVSLRGDNRWSSYNDVGGAEHSPSKVQVHSRYEKRFPPSHIIYE
uniref:Uncharacterized protein n=1 Tax=Odontella aurita TaxID=265563 RepID=A0A7S4M593_9STRA|mmetsp:Transcript_11560/g.34057  ORF Transcript_11560/g.34057 Transcript_11560/m.34057 type:complete len:352 (+) Transcript_11560:409-1464(+)